MLFEGGIQDTMNCRVWDENTQAGSRMLFLLVPLCSREDGCIESYVEST